MRKKLASGLLAGTATVASTVTGMIWPTIDPAIGEWILVGCAIVFVVAVIVFAWPGGPEDKSAFSQSTSGGGSHNFGTVHGNVTIGSTSESPSEPAQEQRASYARIAARHHCPETPIFEAAAYLLRLGRSRNEVRLLLQQAFSDDRLSVWGRPETPPRHMQDPRIPGEMWKPIQPSYWDEFRLTDVIFDANEDHPQTEARPHVMKDLLRRHWALRVSADQVKSEWPEPEPPKRPRPTGPNAWMAG
jgi:hypothetical protein